MRREVVPGEAERADPDLGGEVDAREGIEEGRAGRLAAERRVWQRRRGRGGGVRDARGRDSGGERHDAATGLDLGARPGVPGEADGVGAVRVGGRRGRRRGRVGGRHRGAASGGAGRSGEEVVVVGCACALRVRAVAWARFRRSPVRSSVSLVSRCLIAVRL